MGIAALKQAEGCVTRNGRHVVYDDKTGRPIPDGAPPPRGATIGYGHLVKSGEDFRGGISDAAATALLRDDIAAAERAVCRAVRVRLGQNQYDALVLFAYNIGCDAFAKSTVVKYVNNPSFIDAKYQNLESAWMAWNKSGGCVIPGLTRRRRYEFTLYSTGVY